MNTEVKDVLNASIVLVGVELLNTSEMAANFKDAVKSEVVPGAGALVGAQMDTPLALGRSFSLAKDRIQIQSSPIQSICKLDYPIKEALGRLAEVTYLSIKNTFPTHEKTIPIGYNAELAYEQLSENSADQYIARRIFSPLKDKDKDGWELIGGAGRFSFQENDKRWNVRIEPRFNEEHTSTVFLSVNLHFNKIRLPKTEEEILKSLNTTWEQAHKLVERIDENVTD